MISQQTIEEVRARANLLEVVGELVQLKRQGTSYIGLCPFHSEKTPSFHVREDEGYYHCFGCGVSGGAIEFVMRTRGLSFPEALEDLAARFGVEIKKEGKIAKDYGDKSLRAGLLKVNRMAFEFFSSSLAKAPGVVTEYIRARALTDEALASFGIGFSPKSWGDLVTHLRSKKIEDDIILRSGLAKRSSRGDLYDVFRGRLIFPITTDANKIVGFGGRLISALFDSENIENSPKYLNSSESLVYQKNKILYGLSYGLEHIRKMGVVYVVEGYMDVVGLWQVGVRNVVASCGTAITPEHIKRLSRVAKKIIVLFDGDLAGRQAAGRSFSHFINTGIDVVAKFLPEGHDPDSLARELTSKTAATISALAESPLLECYIQLLIEKQGVKDVSELGAASKGKIASDLMVTLGTVRNPVERGALLEIATRKLQVEGKALETLLRSAPAARPKLEKVLEHSKSVAPVIGNQPEVVRKRIDQLPRLDRELLLSVMGKREELTREVLASPDLSSVLDPITWEFVHGLHEIITGPGLDGEKKESTREYLSSFGESWLNHWRKAFEMLADTSVKLERLFKDCVINAKKSKQLQILNELDRRISTSSSQEEKLSLFQEKLQLKRSLRAHEGQ